MTSNIEEYVRALEERVVVLQADMVRLEAEIERTNARINAIHDAERHREFAWSRGIR